MQLHISLKVEEKSSILTVLSNEPEMGVGALSHQASLEGRGTMMSPSHIHNSLIMENNLSSNLNGADFLQQMSPSPPPTTQGQDVTLLQADLHLNKYRPRQNNVRTPKRNRRLSFGHVQFISLHPAKLQGTIRREGLLSRSIVQESPCSGLIEQCFT